MTPIPETIIKLSFHFSVWTIERFHNMEAYEAKAKELRTLKPGTLGREIADCLNEHKLRLVPGYESHDLKHVLLGYRMTPVDEIRMQAFMLGNRNISLPSIAIFLFGFILLPYKWPLFLRDFQLGLNSKPIKDWTMEQFSHLPTTELRKLVINTSKKPVTVTSWLARIGSISAMIAGISGMLFCLPYLFSPVMEDLVGAGFPFLGGTVLFASGLISLSFQTRLRQPVEA